MRKEVAYPIEQLHRKYEHLLKDTFSPPRSMAFDGVKLPFREMRYTSALMVPGRLFVYDRGFRLVLGIFLRNVLPTMGYTVDSNG